MGPGTRLVQETCPSSGFAICTYAARLPTDWIDFLFSHDPRTGVFSAVAHSEQRALSDEQARFALATLAAEPFMTIGGFMRDGIVQLWSVSVSDVPLTALNDDFVADYFSQDVAETIRASMIWDRPWVAPALSQLIQLSTALSGFGLLAMALAGRIPRRGAFSTLLLLCVAGFVLNALICGILASPYGRFQARVSWLLPFLLTLAVIRCSSRHFRVPDGDGPND
jgi:hypothetical protein